MDNRDLIVYCDRASASARTIARSLGCRRWYEYSTPGRKTAPVVPIVVNWGASNPPLWIRPEHWPWPNAVKYHILNGTELVSAAINKLSTLEALTKAGVPCLEWVIFQEARMPEQQQTVLQAWLEKDGKYIARQTLTGSSGRGLRVIRTAEEHSQAPLYTRYYPKTHEFRVHIWKREVIDFTQKRLKEGVANPNRLVRSHDNGWVHAHEIEEFAQRNQQSIWDAGKAAVESLGLDFGAVDILARFSTRKSRSLKDLRVCEVNTAPGLENSKTIAAYSDAVAAFYKEVKKRDVVVPVVVTTDDSVAEAA